MNFKKKWCKENNYTYTVRTDVEIRENLIHLNNLKYIIGQVKNSDCIQEDELNLMIQYLSIYKSISIRELVLITDSDIGYVLKIVSLLIYKGYCIVLNSSINLSLETEVCLVNDK